MLPAIPLFIDEIIVVDNNSTDNSPRIAQKHHAIVLKEKTQGYGAALLKGISHAKSDIIVIMDADGSYPFSAIKRMADILIRKQCDFVSGNRFAKGNTNTMPLANYIGNKILTLVTNILFKQQIQDSQSGMMLFGRTILPKISLTSTGMSFSEEIKIKSLLHSDIQFKEHPIEYHDDKRLGRKKLRLWKDGMGNVLFLYKMSSLQFYCY